MEYKVLNKKHTKLHNKFSFQGINGRNINEMKIYYP